MKNSEAAHNQPSSYRWFVLFTAFLVFVAYAFALQEAPPLIPSIIDEFGISNAQAGLIMSIVLVPGIFLSLPAGFFVNKYGARRLGLAALSAVIVSSFLIIMANSFVVLLAGRFTLGLGGAFIVATAPAVIAQWFAKEELGKAMGIFGVNMPFATILAFPTASMLIDLGYGWRFPFYFSLVFGIIVAVVFALVVKEGPFARQDKPMTSRAAIGNVEIWKVGLVWLFFNAAALSFVTWAPTLFETFQSIPKVEASFFASLLMWAAIFFVPIYGYLSDRFGRRKFFAVLGAVLMTFAFMSLAYTPNFALVASILALGISAAMIPPIVSALPAEILGSNLAGLGFGVTGMCMNIGGAVAQPFVGFMLDFTQSYAYCLLGMAGLSAAGAVVAFLLKTR
ncbi:MAG: MFS transporter [Candidatus Bathyarchaeales archaeon]